MKLAARAGRIAPSPTLAMAATAKAMAARGIDVADFSSGEPDFDTPEPVKAAAEAAIRAGFTKYTPSSGIDELRQAIIDKLQADQGIRYEKSQVLVSCGAKHSLYNLAEALLEAVDDDLDVHLRQAGDDLVAFQQLVRKVPVAEPVMRHALDIVRATRPRNPDSKDFIGKWVAFGASVRAAQYLVLGGKARALTSGRYHVSFEDIRALTHPVLRHRIITNFHAQSEGITTDILTDRLLDAVPLPRSGM